MPTYVCTAAVNRLTADQKQAIAKVLATAHAEETHVPPYIVQVIFNELLPGKHFINGYPVGPDQIWIRGDIRAGRTDAQKTAIVTRMAKLVSEVTLIDPSFFWIYLCDITKMIEFGSVMPEPGGEAEWIAAIPKDIKARYRFGDTCRL
jgi:phenylpyruvate tautomerase PptA (4-oxalocrotonate tautomerase family)